MGILVANVGYASTKSIFFLVLGAVAIIYMCHHGYKKIKQHSRFEGRKISALSAFSQDTNPAWMRAAVINTMTTYSSSPRLVHEHMPELITTLSSDQQPGGRLYNLLKERQSGQITRVIFRQKLEQYIKYLAAQTGIPYN